MTIAVADLCLGPVVSLNAVDKNILPSSSICIKTYILALSGNLINILSGLAGRPGGNLYPILGSGIRVFAIPLFSFWLGYFRFTAFSYSLRAFLRRFAVA